MLEIPRGRHYSGGGGIRDLSVLSAWTHGGEHKPRHSWGSIFISEMQQINPCKNLLEVYKKQQRGKQREWRLLTHFFRQVETIWAQPDRVEELFAQRRCSAHCVHLPRTAKIHTEKAEVVEPPIFGVNLHAISVGILFPFQVWSGNNSSLMQFCTLFNIYSFLINGAFKKKS